MATRKIQYLAGSLEPEIEARTFPDDSVAASARLMAERYVEMCEASLPYFEVGEWSEICEELRPTKDDGNRIAGPYVPRVRSAVVSGLSARRSKIADPEGFLARLEALSPAGEMAARDMAEKFWAGDVVLPGTHTQETFRIKNSATGVELGDYTAATASDALDMMARDAGYRDHADACNVADGSNIVAELISP